MKIKILLLCFFSLLACQYRREPNVEKSNSQKLTICSQNLNNFGYFSNKDRYFGRKEVFLKQKTSLVKRLLDSKCDIVAVQEVLGNSIFNAKKSLSLLTEEITDKSGRLFDFKIGEVNDRRRFLGFMYAVDKFKYKKDNSYFRTYLPKREKLDPSAGFSRGPFRLDLEHRQTGKDFTFITFHFKSKSSKSGIDYSGYSWELPRMRMAQGLNNILDKLQNELQNTQIIVLGDRNSEHFSASAKILQGELNLNEFKSNGGCHLKKSGKFDCKLKSEAHYESLLERSNKKIATYYYKNKPEWIDDIFVPKNSIEKLRGVEFSSSGVSFKNKNASDHGLLWVSLSLLN